MYMYIHILFEITIYKVHPVIDVGDSGVDRI